MDLIKEIAELKAEYMSPYAGANPTMADVTLRLVGHVLGQYDYDGWKQDERYPILLNAHLLRILHGMGIGLKDRWNYATAKKGGNLYHVFKRLLEQFKGYPSETVTSGWADDYWDDCYIVLALIEARRDAPAAEDQEHRALLSDCNAILNKSLKWLDAQSVANFPNAQEQQWSGPGYHAAALHLFDVAARESLYGNAATVIDHIAAHLETTLQNSLGVAQPWDELFAWHIGQVVSIWSGLEGRYPSVRKLEPLVRKYYDELIGPARRTPGAGWDNGGRLRFKEYVMFGTARGLAAAYAMGSTDVIDDAHAYILSRMDVSPMLDSFKACVNVLETLQIRMHCKLPNPELHLALELGARLKLTNLEGSLLSADAISGANLEPTLRNAREATRDALERRGVSALQPLGVNAELLKFARGTSAVLAEFDGHADEIERELALFLSATMTEVRARAARSLLRRLWTRPGFLYYVPFFERLADLEHMASFFADYRDHVNHQMLVFLFGAFIYYNDASLRTALLEEIAKTNEEYAVSHHVDDGEFLFRWKLASTFHDVGYLFEVSPTNADPAKGDQLIEESTKFVGKWSDEFLVNYLIRFGDDESTAKAVAARISPKMQPYPAVGKISDLFPLLHAGKGDAFAHMSAILPERLGTKLLKGYFSLCSEVDVSPTRKRFYDHGIMSAAVLLKTADVQHHHLTGLRKLANDRELASEKSLKKVLKEKQTAAHLKQADYWVRFKHVAGAIALHNIYPALHKDEAALKKYAVYDAFCSPPTADHFRIDPAETPLAWLMAFADALQDWDRHSFRPPSVADRSDRAPLSGHEILLAYHKGKLNAVGLNLEARRRYRDRINEMKITLNAVDDHIVKSAMLR